MKEEIRIFFTSLMFYTRIPSPIKFDYDPDYINKATRYFPLIGWIVGLISFGVYWLSSILFDTSIAVVFSLIAGVLTTGAFHEDGLADVMDGFGGGWIKTKILEIMKDSRVGAYGAIALVLLFLIKYTSLLSLFTTLENQPPYVIALYFVSYHALGRLTAINIVFTSVYSREDATSKVKPIAKQHGWKEIIGAYFFGITPLFLLGQWHFFIVLLPLFVTYLYSKKYFEKWIDGYSGDCLGAVEQIAECVSLLTFISIWKFM
ncbi:adenosylcobinamide-GDP ribazoletransferase [Flammeovirga agarivorans]|uniref:Adenosylcobinamide-GDP ribazoletransferase n=1 Tax=Flammeovirga agarivorans TaxID=2726742 RepID=A0A7X8SQC8_9BACT|nr:adenosylcobinamide-GDP ribazoletransferase [Flammeovirga agarivorans]NLR94469.1 adenosylcobinamide-GDP ribazoletransferase [Flammeovirga agarivorans]